MSVLICPLCGEDLFCNNKSYSCKNRHSFDISREGYVNFLGGAKPGLLIGDNKSMAISRREFLSKGFYRPLADKLISLIKEYKNKSCPAAEKGGRILDACCGEGYYSSLISEALPDFSFYGFDISKEMIRLAAKRKSSVRYFVANMKNIPLSSGSFNVITHMFAPFYASEFSRVLNEDGILFSAAAGARHLYSFKEILYEKAYLNEEKAPDAPGFVLKDIIKISDEIYLSSAEEIFSLLKMTPYFYHTPAGGLQKLEKYTSLISEAEFVIYIYRKGE